MPNTQTMTNSERVIAQLHATLAHAVTEYDRKQAGKRGYNHYALAHYLGAVQTICAELTVDPDRLTRDVIIDHFNGRLLDVCLRACGFNTSTRQEQQMGTL